MNRLGKSDNSIVAAKLPNKAGQPVTEVVEGRGLTKENAGQQNTRRTQGRESVPSALERIREAANSASTSSSEVGAVCASRARTDLCGGAARKGGPYRDTTT